MNNPRGVIVITFDVLIPPTPLSLMVSQAGFYESSLLSAPFIPAGGEITSLPVIPNNYPDSPHVSYRASLAHQTCQHFPLGPCGTYFCEP